MFQKPKESDWKHFRKVSPLALQRLSQRALDKLQSVAGDESKSAHDRYLEVFRQIQKFDKEISKAFDALSRSQMTLQLLHLRRLELLTDEEFAGFSAELQEFVKSN